MTTNSLVFPTLSTTGAVAVSTEPQPQKHKCLDDFLLAQKAASGDMVAFKKIYDKNHCRVYGVSLRMTGDRCLAEDMAQEVFIQVFRKIGNFKGDSTMTTWIHRITVNEVLMYFRRKSVKHEHTSKTGELPEQIVTGSTQPKRMQVVDKIALERAIKKLPDGYRNVFVLHDVIGFTHPQMAEILGVTEGTTKSQLHKARLKLQELLSE